MFVSWFFPVFLGSVIILFFSLPARWRPMVLLLSSWFFCGYISIEALLILIVTSVCVYLAGIKIEISHNRGFAKKSRIETGCAVIICVLLLCLSKYSHFFVQIGLSFYLFQAIGYLMDIYWGKCKAERNFCFFGCYFAFFAKLVSGPIEREEDFLHQMRRIQEIRFWHRGRLSDACSNLLWGYFMKMVVADRLAITVNILFEGPQSFDSFWLVLGMLFYTIQIYCDFAGYSYIAIGCAQIFGIKLTQNFAMPYFADNISDFWKRWHISLSRWLKDYIYIPLGGKRKGRFRKYFNTMAVFLICGVWHGAGFHFIAWGFLHGLYSIVDSAFTNGERKRAMGKVTTFLSVSFAWIFFRAESFTGALRYIRLMFSAGFWPAQAGEIMTALKLNPEEILVMAVGIITVFVIEKMCYDRGVHFPEWVQDRQNVGRYLIFYLLFMSVFVFGIYGPGYQAEQFIYMQF